MSGGFISLFKKKADEEEPSKFGLAPIFKYEELKRATNTFSTEIGNGGFGRVYLGTLRDGREVAVKELFDRNPKRLEQFLNEVTVFSRLRHKNLVTLYGCTNPRSQKLFLVYDYVPNGTVADHLYGQRSNLTLSLRIQIAVETAEALTYLHACDPPVIHRDVKTPNILLDYDFHVKLADLGICRLLPWDTTHVSTDPQGTLGYRDPEYDQYLRLTDKTDVYSFGVVLMELISGQQAVDVNRELAYIYLVHLVLNKKPEEIVDPKIGYHYNDDVKRIINSVAELASQCLQPTGDTRPPMLQVLSVLKEIQSKMLEIGENVVDVMYIAPQQDPGLWPPTFREYGLEELRAATKGFSAEMIVSKSGEKALNVVYRGKLDRNQLVAVKRFSKQSWPNAKQFVAEASGVGRVRHKRLVNLIGCCAEGDERLLVAEFMPNDTLADHLFHGDRQLPWAMRLRVAYYIAQALDHCNSDNREIYHNLNVRRVLFDERLHYYSTGVTGPHDHSVDFLEQGYEIKPKVYPTRLDGDPHLSSFGLMKNSRDGKSYSTYLSYTPPEILRTGKVIPESVIHNYGTVLLDLLRGGSILPGLALSIIKSKDVSQLIDLSLEEKGATKLVDLCKKCMRHEARDRPNLKFLISAIALLQRQKKVASHVLMGLSKTTVVLPTMLSPTGEASARMDPTAIDDLLLQTDYKDEEGAENNVT